MQTTAAVLRESGAPYSIEELELPDLRSGEVLVRVVGVGHCHTDTLFRHLPGGPLPFVPGHEGSGVVEKVGPGVTGVAVRDHVVLSFDSCGACRNCLIALPSYCDQFMARNLSGAGVDGCPGALDAKGTQVGHRWFGQSSFATYAISTVRNTVVVDQGLDLEVLGPLGCGIQTGAGSVINSLQLRPGSTIAVFGVGAVGMGAVMAARLAGASKVIAVDLQHSRLDLALSLGATHGIDAASTEDAATEIQALSGGGVDYSFDTTAVPAVMRSAVASLRMSGTCGLVGAGGQPIEFGAAALYGKTVTGILEGGAVPQVFIPKMIEWWRAGEFPFDRLVQRFPLSEIDAAESRAAAGQVVKPVLLPGQ